MDTESQKNNDYYFDPSGHCVFTPEFLLKRGTCCSNGCRHCPYQPQSDLQPITEDSSSQA